EGFTRREGSSQAMMTAESVRRAATQLPPLFNDAVRNQLPGIELLPTPRVDFTLPDEIRVLFAAPAGVNAARPPGWPFGLRWIQLAGVGVDHYPPWTFEVEQVTTAHGTSAQALAEFALAAIFAHAKGLPQRWVRDAE